MPYRVSIDQVPFQLDIQEIGRQKYLIRHKNSERVVEAFSSNLSLFTVLIDNRSYDVCISNGQESPTVSVNGKTFQLAFDRTSNNVKIRPTTKPKGPVVLKASMPGKVVKLLVKAGDQVLKNQPLLVLEAMKMENEVCSPYPGAVTEISVQTGQNVENGQKLLTVVAA